MKRSDFPTPATTMLIDLNSEAAFQESGMTPRKAPRLLPVPFRTISASPNNLVLEPWRKDLKMYPQLYFLLSKDIPAGSAVENAVLGIGIGLAYSDNGIVLASPDPSPRDRHMCYWYSLYSDDSQVLSQELFSGVDPREITLTLESETLGRHVFHQKDLLFGPVDVLREMGCLVSFQKYDLISLGAAGAPVSVPAGKKFRPGEMVAVSGGPLGELKVTVDDRRDASVVIPTWTPRDFFLNKEYQA